jgi:hypothetical protein
MGASQVSTAHTGSVDFIVAAVWISSIKTVTKGRKLAGELLFVTALRACSATHPRTLDGLQITLLFVFTANWGGSAGGRFNCRRALLA